MSKIRSSGILAIIILTSFSHLLQSCGTGDRGEVRTPTSTTAADTSNSVTEPSISTSHIFFENSGSMNGYLNGNHEMKVVVSRLAFALNEKSASQRFYFYNTKAHPLPAGTTTPDFISRLTPGGIKVGNVSTSNLNSILEGVLNSTEDSDVGILITDGIYSMNAASGSLLGQLQVASEGTYSQFRKRLSKSNLQTVVVKLSSHFSGPYYSANGKTITINQKRPYYLWMFGVPDRIDRIKNDFKITELPGYVNHVVFRAVPIHPPYYSVNSTYKLIGSFKPVRSKSDQITAIEEAERRKNVFQFSLEVDMSDVPAGENYLLDTSNYRVTNGKFNVTEISHASTLTGKAAFELSKAATHLITLSTDKHPHGDIKISLANNLPKWISDTSSEDDSNINGDTLTTYGFEYLIDGIVRAYRSQNPSRDYFQLEVSIKGE